MTALQSPLPRPADEAGALLYLSEGESTEFHLLNDLTRSLWLGRNPVRNAGDVAIKVKAFTWGDKDLHGRQLSNTALRVHYDPVLRVWWVTNCAQDDRFCHVFLTANDTTALPAPGIPVRAGYAYRLAPASAWRAELRNATPTGKDEPHGTGWAVVVDLTLPPVELSSTSGASVSAAEGFEPAERPLEPTDTQPSLGLPPQDAPVLAAAYGAYFAGQTRRPLSASAIWQVYHHTEFQALIEDGELDLPIGDGDGRPWGGIQARLRYLLTNKLRQPHLKPEESETAQFLAERGILRYDPNDEHHIHVSVCDSPRGRAHDRYVSYPIVQPMAVSEEVARILAAVFGAYLAGQHPRPLTPEEAGAALTAHGPDDCSTLDVHNALDEVVDRFRMPDPRSYPERAAGWLHEQAIVRHGVTKEAETGVAVLTPQEKYEYPSFPVCLPPPNDS